MKSALDSRYKVMFKTVSKHRGIEALMNNKTGAVQLILNSTANFVFLKFDRL